MFIEEIQKRFESDFNKLTEENIQKITHKIKFRDDDLYDEGIENSFINILGPHLEKAIKLGIDSVEKSLEKESQEGDLIKDLGIWDDNFPTINTPKPKNNSHDLLYRNYDENGKLKEKPKLETLPFIITKDENGNVIDNSEMNLFFANNEPKYKDNDLLFSGNPFEIAKNIYKEQLGHIQKIVDEFKDKINFFDIISEELENIFSHEKNINYLDCIFGKMFHNDQTACFKLFLDRNNLKGYKKRVTRGDDRVEDICRYNSMQDYIPFNDNFISGHFSPPGHYGCRCHLEFKTEENLDFSIEKYILKTKKILDLIEEEKQQKLREKEEEEKREEEERKKFIEKIKNKALEETKKVLENIMREGGEVKVRDYYFGWKPVKTTDKEDKLFRDLWFWELKKLDDNKNLAWGNEKYRQMVKNIKDTDTYKKLREENDDLLATFGWNSQNNVLPDAIRHAYRNALNAKDFGIDMAKKMGDYHESFDGNTGITCIIDLYNNSIGRSLGEKYKDKTDEEILDIIIENKDLFLYGEPKEDGTWVGNENYQEVEKYLNNNNLGEK